MKRSDWILLIFAVLVAALTCARLLADEQHTWQAVGDDDMTGRATGYVMVLARDSLTIVNADNGHQGWITNTPGLTVITADILPTPAEPGTWENFTMETKDFEPGTWFASIKAFDEAGNWGALGNIKRFVISDVTSPAAIITLR
jgi:hypothetical protein